jgi:very-short-patch-repair endonuclease
MYPVRRQINPNAARLRLYRTDAEDHLWQALRNRQLAGHKFRFQHSLGAFVVDFACLDAKLVVEVDGGQHNDEIDARRTSFLEAQGFRILRFWNHDVLTNRDGVLAVIQAALAEQG